jgi:archaellum component FlaC
MILLTIFTIITIFLTFYIYYKKTDKSEIYNFNSLSTLLQTTFVFITLYITIYTIQSSNSATNKLFDNLNDFNSQFSKMEFSLEDVSQKLKILPEQIEKFSKSLDTLNSITSIQSQNFKKNTSELNNTIGELATSVKNYEENIDNYSSQIKTIVDLTDKQLMIWKEQQRVLLDEFSRKPVLKIETKQIKYSKDTCEIVDIVFINDGNIEANVRAIFVFVPLQAFIDFESLIFKFYKNDLGYKIYKLDPFETSAETIAASSDIILPFSLKFFQIYKDKIRYRIGYFSKYKSGQEIGDLKIQ